MNCDCINTVKAAAIDMGRLNADIADMRGQIERLRGAIRTQDTLLANALDVLRTIEPESDIESECLGELKENIACALGSHLNPTITWDAELSAFPMYPAAPL